MMIETWRLKLIPFTPAFLRASLNGDFSHAAAILGFPQPDNWPTYPDTYQRRLNQLEADASLLPWLLRGIILRETGLLIGQIGFHTAPNPVYLAELAPGGIELGYTVFPPFQRQGFVSEAMTGLMNWARTEHGITRFVVSIAPENIPSLAVATKFGFHYIGEHIDEVDGVEHIFGLDLQSAKPGGFQ